MRNRSQVTSNTSVAVPDFNQTWVGHGSYLVPTSGETIDGFKSEETMSDDPTGNRRYKAVVHEKSSVSRSSISSETTVSGGETYVSSGTNCFWHVWNGMQHGYFISHRHISKSFPIGQAQLVRETMDLFYNVNQVDNLLNIVESPELVTSLKSLYARVIAAKPYHGRITKNSLRRASRDFFGQNLAVYSGGYLYYKFGVAPIISDMRKISSHLDKYRKQLKAYKKHAGTPVSVHKTVSGVIDGIVADGNGNLPSGYGAGPDTNSVWGTSLTALSTPRMTCTIRGIREFKYSMESFRTLDYLISRFGVSGPASFLWERIPFSFVVDWFVDLSGVLNALDNALTGNAKKITDAGISIGWKVGAPIVKHRYMPTLTSSNDGTQIAYVELGSFLRIPVVPTVSVGFNSRFGKSQLGITAALVGQMAANLIAKRKA